MTFILLDNSQDPDGRSFLFREPGRIISVTEADGVEDGLSAIAEATRAGLYAAGFLSYELGYVMEPRLAPLLPARRALPLIWMGLFERPRELGAAETASWLAASTTGEARIGRVRPTVGRAAYRQKFARALDHIARGDIYQINLTFKARFSFAGDPVALYADLRHRQKVAYGALIAAPDFHLLSLSPELFLRVDGRHAECRPMKGTARRGASPEEDWALRRWLQSDVKSRAENLMIVDLMRNDLGRVAEIGSVAVPELFSVETYRTVLQMTSLVTARLRPEIGFAELMHALFSPGSVTGAPKVRAMEIIRAMEDEPREVYTGAIGMIGPGGAVLNVAIRTLVLGGAGEGEIGIGSGVVQDSQADAEYDECLLKMRFLTEPRAGFKLIETLLWRTDTGYRLLDGHVARLIRSARHFRFPCHEQTVRRRLAVHAEGLSEASHRVRLTLDEYGEIAIADTVLAPSEPDAVWRYALSDRPVSSADPFLYHKTTRRAFYDGERQRLSARLGCQEVIFVNERGELTEGSFTTLFLEREGRLLTPALSCGLLPGTLRQELLDGGRAKEAVLTPADLAGVEAVWLGNSVRGLTRAEPAVLARALSQ